MELAVLDNEVETVELSEDDAVVDTDVVIVADKDVVAVLEPVVVAVIVTVVVCDDDRLGGRDGRQCAPVIDAMPQK